MTPYFAVQFFIFLLVVVAIYLWWRKRPTNDANWSLDQKILAYADFDNNNAIGKVTVHNIRNITYRSETDYTPAYYDKTFDISKINSVDFVFVPYSKFKSLAHTFLTFGFEDGSHIAISVEIRKKVGQNFSALKSLFKQYELTYVVADENDVIKLRTNYRHEPVYLYPVKATKEQITKMFLSMLKRVNSFKEKPEFYSLFNNTCTTNIARHINEITQKKFFSFKVLLPGYSERLAYELRMINTNLSFEEMHAKFYINDKAMSNPEPTNFSEKIRL